MTSQEIRNTIRANEKLIGNYQSQKRTLENQIDDLERLRDKFSNLQRSFEERQNLRRNKVDRFSSTPIKNKIFEKYYVGIHDLLNGNSFANAYDGLSVAKSSIWTRIDDMIKKVEEYDSTIKYLYARNEYWKEELTKAIVRECAMEENG